MVGRIEYGLGRTGGEALFVPRRRPASKLHGAPRFVPARCPDQSWLLLDSRRSTLALGVLIAAVAQATLWHHDQSPGCRWHHRSLLA